MTREDVGIILEVFNMTEMQFLTVAFFIPIACLMWASTFYFCSRFIFMALNIWKTTENDDDKQNDERRGGFHFPR
jgi:hypothetical protein